MIAFCSAFTGAGEEASLLGLLALVRVLFRLVTVSGVGDLLGLACTCLIVLSNC